MFNCFLDRHRVDERKVELERLERRIFPAGRMVFDDGIEGGDGGQAGENANQIVSNLEAAFTKLKVATGSTQNLVSHPTRCQMC